MLKVYLRLFCFLFCICNLLCKPLNVLAEADPAAALQELKKGVRFITLENGLRVVLYKRGIAPVFAGLVAVRVGGVDETPGHTGISHMLEHMAFKGTPSIGTSDYPRERKLLDELEVYALKESNGDKLSDEESKRKGEINSELSSLWTVGDFSIQYDARGAAEMNATTSKEITNYFVNLPRSAFEFWCWAESERLLFPVMRQFYQERDVVMEERRMRSDDDPQGRLYEMLLGVAYLKHPYRNPVIGYPDDIKRLTASMTADFHRQYYVPENIVIAIVGDVDADADLETIKKYFGRLKPGTVPARTKLVEEPQNGERRFSLERDASPVVNIAYHKPNYPHPDDAPISLMGEILTGSRVSPLYTELVKKKRVASAVNYDEEPGVSYPNLMLFSLAPNRPHTNEHVLAEFDTVISQFKQRNVTDEELLIAKRSTAVEYLSHIKSNLALAKDFAASELLFNNWHASFDWYEAANKVTKEDIERVSKVYLSNASRVVAIVAPTKVRTE